jgi:hypothetical protein
LLKYLLRKKIMPDGRHSNCGKKEVMCRHREKYGAIQQRGKGKRRLMQPARRPAIANAGKQSMHVH